MIRTLLLILILVGSVTSARTEKIRPIPAPTSPKVLDVIGKSTDNDLIARFSVLKDELASDAKAQAYIINYGIKAQIQKRVRQIQKALAFHRIDPKRVAIVSGGDRESLETKIYIVPKGATIPIPILTARIFATVFRTRKRELAKQMENFQSELYKDPTSSGYVINYGTDKEIARREKIFRDSVSWRLDPSRITFIRGGHSGKITVGILDRTVGRGTPDTLK